MSDRRGGGIRSRPKYGLGGSFGFDADEEIVGYLGIVAPSARTKTILKQTGPERPGP